MTGTAKGPKGDRGPQGPKGDPGPKGPKGDSGSSGSRPKAGGIAESAQHVRSEAIPPAQQGNVLAALVHYVETGKLIEQPDSEKGGDGS